MNTMLLTGGPQITADSSILDRLTLGGSTLLLGMVLVFAVLGIIFFALQIMRSVFTKKSVKAQKVEKAEESAKPAEQPVAVAEEEIPAEAEAADDGAIVAAIIAAISVHTGKAPDGFRVVSFKKRK